MRYLYRLGRAVADFRTDTRGSTAIEYGMICALVFLAVVASMQTFGVKTSALFDLIASKY